MSAPNFRLLTAADAADYQKLRLEALARNPESFLGTLETEKTRSLEYFEREIEFASHLPVYGYHGVWQDQTDHQAQLLGYVQIDTSYLPKQRHVAFLYNLYVSHLARRQGLGRLLCQHVFTELKNQTQVELIYLGCNSGNLQARNFYHSLGFKRCGIKPRAIKWQGVYDDEVEMVLELSGPTGN
ncbi:MAG TPA: hypothetical protein DEP87_04145 [Candidatus Pacebacteria bacterium]|nr:hypothetical protein [Candidatus Paceibacterota bacterium]